MCFLISIQVCMYFCTSNHLTIKWIAPSSLSMRSLLHYCSTWLSLPLPLSTPHSLSRSHNRNDRCCNWLSLAALVVKVPFISSYWWHLRVCTRGWQVQGGGPFSTKYICIFVFVILLRNLFFLSYIFIIMYVLLFIHIQST